MTSKGGFLVFSLSLWLGSCGAQPSAEGDLVIGPTGRGRFIVDDPQVVLANDYLVQERQVFEWDLGRLSEADRWRAGPTVASRHDSGEGLTLAVTKGMPAVRRPAAIDAQAMAVIEVEAVGGGPFLELSWAGPGQRLDPMRTLRVSRAGNGRQSKATYRFLVGLHRQWGGDVRVLRLRGGGPDRDLVLQRVVGYDRTLRSGAAKEAASKAWKVELEHDVRNAYMTQPGDTVARTLRVPADATLRFALGTEPSVREAVVFRVRVVPVVAGSNEDASGDGGASDATIVFERRLSPGAGGGTPAWHEVEVALVRWAGQRVRLALETTADATFDPDHGFALWANPEVVVPSRARPPSVLFVSMDTLRADRLSSYGYPKSTTPRLDAWAARRAVRFRNVVAAAPWTLPSHVSMFTGLDATRHGINHDVGRLDSQDLDSPHTALDLLAERLRRDGFATGAFTGGAYLHPQFGFAQGFDTYAYWPDRSRDKGELTTGVSRALAWFERHRDEPSFFFLHSYEVHDPYRPHQPHLRELHPNLELPPDDLRAALQSPSVDPSTGFRQMNDFVVRGPGTAVRPATAEDLTLIGALYDSGVAAMDAQLGDLFDQLEQQGLDTKLLTVVTSDHGEGLGEHGRFGHIDLYDAQLKVPLMIARPRNGEGEVASAGTVIEDQVRSIDLVPTVLQLVDRAPAKRIDGVSLEPLMAGQRDHVPRHAWSYAASSNRGLSLRYGNRLKLIMPNNVWAPRGVPELYDLSKDPDEADDRFAATAPDRAGTLMAEALAHLRRARGLELRISNRSEGTLSGALSGAMVRPVGSKASDLDCDCLRWEEMGKASFEVPPGEAFSVRFEKIFGRRLTVRGSLAAESHADFNHTFDVRGLDDMAYLRFKDGRWSSGRSAPEDIGGTGFTVRWRGGPGATDGPSAIDNEVREQLEALGYVH